MRGTETSAHQLIFIMCPPSPTGPWNLFSHQSIPLGDKRYEGTYSSISILHTSYVTGRIVFNTINRKFLSALPSCLKWNSQSGLNLNFGHVYVAHQVSYAAPSEHKETSVPLFWLSICLIYHHSPIIPHRSAFFSNQWKDLACDWQLIYSSEKGPLRSERPVPGQRRWEKYEKYVCTHCSQRLLCSVAKWEPISASS